MEATVNAQKVDITKIPKFKKSPYIVLQYKWNVKAGQENKSTPTILSKMIKFQGEKSFRAGLKNRGSYATKLFFVTTNLNKQGIRVQRVMFIPNLTNSSTTAQIEVMELKVGGTICPTDGSIQLFTAPILNWSIASDSSFTFHIYIDGIVKDYRAQNVNCLLTDQLWTSALNRSGTDFEFTVDGKSFPVHKFILAARSPIIAAQLKEEPSTLGSKQTIDWVDASSMEQFLKFVYTGTLEGPINSILPLLQLAETYQVKTLESLCRLASRDIDEDDLGRVALQLKSSTPETLLHMTPSPLSENVFPSDSFEIESTWTVNLPQRKDFETMTEETEAFEFDGKKMFRVQLEALWKPITNFSSSMYNYSFTLTVLCYMKKTNYKIDQISYSFANPANANRQFFVFMIEKQKTERKLLQVFTSTLINVAAPLFINFYVKLSRTVPGFKDKFMDSTWNKQLGGAARQLLTDVELQVGGTSFPAHRFILSAQSPVFEAMFNSGMKESQTGSVRIDDVDSSTFKEFLDFLYTGMLPPSAIKEELFTVADKYQVKSLMDICKNVSIEKMTNVYLAF